MAKDRVITSISVDSGADNAKVPTYNSTTKVFDMSTPSGGGSSIPNTIWSGVFSDTAANLANHFQKLGSPTGGNQGASFQTTTSAGTQTGLRAFPESQLTGTVTLNANTTLFFGVNGAQSQLGTDHEAFFGLGDISGTATGQTWTIAHIGFKVKRNASGAVNVYASQANGTTQSETLLTTLASTAFTDNFEFKLVVNGTTSVSYYYSKNYSAFSSATTITTNMPTTMASYLSYVVGNVNVATNTGYNIAYSIYSRS